MGRSKGKFWHCTRSVSLPRLMIGQIKSFSHGIGQLYDSVWNGVYGQSKDGIDLIYQYNNHSKIGKHKYNVANS